jgi:signal transduction histidine kinase
LAVVAAASAATLALVVTAWQRQVTQIREEVGRYARSEGLAVARTLLYDLAADPSVLKVHLLESRLLEMRAPAGEAADPRLVDLVRAHASLPDTRIWELASAAGLGADLRQVESARALCYREEIDATAMALGEDLSARISFSEHLRGVRLASAGGLAEIEAGERWDRGLTPVAGDPVRVLPADRVLVSLPLYVNAKRWGRAELLMDRRRLASLAAETAATFRWSLSALILLLGLFIGVLLFGWAFLIRALRLDVVRPVASLAARMESWADSEQKGDSAPDPDEPAQLAEVFERMTRRIRDQQDQLLRVQRLALLERLGAALSHEINNALNPAVLRLDALALEARDPTREDVEVLRGYLRTAQRVLKDFASATRGAPGPDCRVGPREWFAAALLLVEPAAARKGVALDAQGAQDGPAVLGDAQSLVQVTANLLFNALDAVRAGDGRIWARLQTDAGGEPVLTVEDDGPGLPQEVRGRAFEPFVTTKAQGTGLGLYVVEALVRKMGGRVEIEDRPQGGTTVRVILRPASAGGGSE